MAGDAGVARAEEVPFHDLDDADAVAWKVGLLGADFPRNSVGVIQVVEGDFFDLEVAGRPLCTTSARRPSPSSRKKSVRRTAPVPLRSVRSLRGIVRASVSIVSR